MKPQSYQRESIFKKNNNQEIAGLIRICEDNIDSIRKFQKSQEKEKQLEAEEKEKEDLRNQNLKKQMKMFLHQLERKKNTKKHQNDERIKLGGKGNDEIPEEANKMLNSPIVEKTLSFFQCDDLRIAKRVEKYLKEASQVKQEVKIPRETEWVDPSQKEQIHGMLRLKNLNLKNEIDEMIDSLEVTNKEGIKDVFYVEECKPDPHIKYRKFLKREKSKGTNSHDNISLRPSLLSKNNMTSTSFNNQRSHFEESATVSPFRPNATNQLKKLLNKVMDKFERQYKKNSVFNQWERINAICQTELLKGVSELEKYHSEANLREKLEQLQKKQNNFHDQQEKSLAPSVRIGLSFIQQILPKIHISHLIKENKKLIRNQKSKTISRMFI